MKALSFLLLTVLFVMITVGLITKISGHGQKTKPPQPHYSSIFTGDRR